MDATTASIPIAMESTSARIPGWGDPLLPALRRLKSPYRDSEVTLSPSSQHDQGREHLGRDGIVEPDLLPIDHHRLPRQCRLLGDRHLLDQELVRLDRQLRIAREDLGPETIFAGSRVTLYSLATGSPPLAWNRKALVVCHFHDAPSTG
jgi:hypothetical protein